MPATPARSCARCGHDLGVGRFCTNCGQAVADTATGTGDWRTDTAERIPAQPAPPRVAPPAYEAPGPARYPLWADGETAAAAPSADAPTEVDDEQATPPARRRRSAAPLIGVVAALVLVLGGTIGMVLLLGSDADESAAPDAGTSDSSAPSTPSGEPSQTTGGPRPPSPSPTKAPTSAREITARARAVVPATATPSRDVKGRKVGYDAINMLDDDLDTAWRMPGSARNQTIVIDLAETTRITEVGLVNGYAKSEPGYDGYAANRRILEVAWTFDDGTVVNQVLVDGERGLQRVQIKPVRTGTVRLEIVRITKPTKGPSGRDYTAISELLLDGEPERR